MEQHSEIRFKIALDEERFPEKIYWEATDADVEGLQEAKAINLSIWDHLEQNTLRIDLWQKEMPVEDMKRFFVDTIGGMAESIRSSTDDDYMADQMEALCERLIEYMKSGKKA